MMYDPPGVVTQNELGGFSTILAATECTVSCSASLIHVMRWEQNTYGDVRQINFGHVTVPLL